MVPQRLFCSGTLIPAPAALGIARIGPSIIGGIGYAAFEGPGYRPGEYEYLRASRKTEVRERAINIASGRGAEPCAEFNFSTRPCALVLAPQMQYGGKKSLA
jgi:hypothetical protein